MNVKIIFDNATKLFHRMTIAGMLLLWSAPTPVATAQQGTTSKAPATSPKRAGPTQIRSSDEVRDKIAAPGTEKSRQEVLAGLEEIAVQQNVTEELLKELDKNFDGTPGQAAGRHLLEIRMIADRAQVLSAAAGHVEEYRQERVRDLARKFALLNNSQGELQAMQPEIEDLADQLALNQDAQGQPLTPEQVESLKGQLYERKQHQRDKEARRDRWQEDVEFNKQELVHLSAVDRFLDGRANQDAARVKRLIDAAGSEQDAASTRNAKGQQEEIRTIISLIRGGPTLGGDLASSGFNPGDRRGPGLGEVVKSLPTRLTPEAEKVIEAEVQKARSRAQQRAVPPAPKAE